MPILDLDTLRATQAAVGLCVFLLVYLGTYRPTRAPYAGWWSAALLAAGVGALVTLLAPSVGRPADALGNAASVLGAAFAWSAAASIDGRRTARLAVAVGPVAIFAWTMLGIPGVGTRPGALAVVLGIGAYAGLASGELWRLLASRRWRRRPRDGAALAAVVSMLAAAAGSALYCAVGAGLIVGAELRPELRIPWAGPTAAALASLAVLVVITGSITELSHVEMSRRWYERATRDDLTGLLLREPFRERAEAAIVSDIGRGHRSVLVLADLDHFKALNDTYGHAEGDRALRAFGRACRGLTRDGDLSCRLGGEEFGLLLRAVSAEEASAVCERLTASFSELCSDGPAPAPTVSYGLAVAGPGATLDASLVRADGALYRAKSQGRDRVEVDDGVV
ncbi:GGDEF domain-containing protein [Demequina sp. NBRC 110054]|uniref:GGDEF domain-containing protein n=1 Tax=Demequina sp. NBRC 110054 TaxID=1570343 RepID=UPI0009FE0120|nr:GGDEF domain-containing protein [Demequina sp. NBRC 110054]